MTMADLYQRTLEKKHYLESLGNYYIITWECEFDREILDNIDIKSLVDKVNYVTPLEPREAFLGGRTEAFKLSRG
jgi:G:T-mismatch repair DNA endonuclease (very short patch repair protein)